jgi:hypothetical protein
MIPGSLFTPLIDGGLFFLDLTISQNTSNVDVNLLAKNNGWDEVQSLILNLTINSGVTVSSTSTAIPALEVKALPVGSFVRITNRGSILGKGGNGGAGGVNNGNGGIGSNGGLAFRTAANVTLNNLGTINGGDGGQGGGAAVRNGGVSGTTSAGCSGGINCIGVSGASCQNGFCNTNVGPNGNTGGSTGSTGLTGASGSNASYGTSVACGTQCGGGSCNRTVSCLTGLPGNGGLAGPAISGNSLITYINTGNRNGPIT